MMLMEHTKWEGQILRGVTESAQPLAVRHLLARAVKPCIYITHHDKHVSRFIACAPFFLPNIEVIAFPAWDCMPYDRASVRRTIMAARVSALTRILELSQQSIPFVVATTVNAWMQCVPPVASFRGTSTHMHVKARYDRDALMRTLEGYGYRRVAKVMEAGEYALRGSVMDIFPASSNLPYRLDWFDDEVESMRLFDPLTQRSGEIMEHCTLCPTSELVLTPEKIALFRTRYREAFGAPHRDDALYHTVSEGNDYAGMEHWLPMFYDSMDTLHDYVGDAHLCLDHGLLETCAQRAENIVEYYQARRNDAGKKQSAIYHPITPESFFLHERWELRLERHHAVLCTPFDAEDDHDSLKTRPAKNLFTLALSQKITPFEMLTQELMQQTRPILLATQSEGSAERLATVLKEQHIAAPQRISHYDEIKRAKGGLFLSVLPLAGGYATSECLIYSESDILGQRIIPARRKTKPSEAFLAELSAFDVGELLVHRDHGIGKFDGLVTLDINNHQHDCIKLVYRDNDRLFVPVENLELLTRHGSDMGDVELDKLGAGSWQARKATYKEKLRLTAEALLKTAALRELLHADALHCPEELYQNFVNRFPYEETEDQLNAIDDVLQDLGGTKPMDRLICGDVGFGKTEVALRAAFVAATDAVRPQQVAFIAPTTLLARQHYHTFKERFTDTGLEVAQLSRMCSAAEAKRVREKIADGTLDIVIGTHALLSEQVKFKRLGLMVVDEEQRFGVKQKEQLKNMRANMHILTMSATPIPRTLQMSLTGVRDLSLITTPPMDRLSIRSFVMPFDAVVMREAIMRELHRGGQVFYVAPRIADLPELTHKIRELVPEARLAIAHGQMPATELERIMNAFYDGSYDILLATTIIESGIDVPNANTMIIHRADRFGLAQLYQLRGRVGRGKVRAYAYFTLPYHGAMSKQAVKRLEVMQSLDTLGAGFTLASHDMDIRGFGNLVGEEQSGHVKDIGIELYQQMLSDAVRLARATNAHEVIVAEDDWSPQLNLGLSIMIPESYVDDLSLRLSLYRRAATLTTSEEVEAFAAELIDRFGAIPEATQHLFTTLKLKHQCKNAGISRIDTGPKGAVLHMHHASIRNPQALIGYIAKHGDTMKLRADQSIFYAASWDHDATKLADIRQLVSNIAAL